MRVRILYADWENLGRDERVDAHRGNYVGPENYKKVDEFEFGLGRGEDARLELLEAIFEEFNIGDHRGKECRSLSTGDIVMIGPRAYMCASVGWDELDMKKMSDLRDEF